MIAEVGPGVAWRHANASRTQMAEYGMVRVDLRSNADGDADNLGGLEGLFAAGAVVAIRAIIARSEVVHSASDGCQKACGSC